MKYPFRPAAIVIAVLAVVTGGCSLLDPLPPVPTLFQQMDTNHDSKLTRVEFDTGFADALLRDYNVSGNGAITPAEWQRFERRVRSDFFQRLDVNHDGGLTRSELATGKDRDTIVNILFDRIDKNHDGIISMEEGRPSNLDSIPRRNVQVVTGPGTGIYY